MADLTTFQNRRRIYVVTHRSAWTLAFIACIFTRQILVWTGTVKAGDSVGALILSHFAWFIAAGILGGACGALLGYTLVTRWLKSKPADY